MAKKTAKAKTNNGVNLGIEAELWQAADKLRGAIKETFMFNKSGESTG